MLGLEPVGEPGDQGYSEERAASQVAQVVGGCEEAAAAVLQAIRRAMVWRDALQTYGLSAPSGLLVYGPPGTGKTLLAG